MTGFKEFAASDFRSDGMQALRLARRSVTATTTMTLIWRTSQVRPASVSSVLLAWAAD